MTEIHVTQMGITAYLAPSAQFNDNQSVAALVEKVQDCLAGHQVNQVIDLDSVASLNNMALKALLDIQDRLAERGGGLKVVNANALVQDIFLVTDFANFVEVMPPFSGRNR